MAIFSWFKNPVCRVYKQGKVFVSDFGGGQKVQRPSLESAVSESRQYLRRYGVLGHEADKLIEVSV
jgi:hypothetical protein